MRSNMGVDSIPARERQKHLAHVFTACQNLCFSRVNIHYWKMRNDGHDSPKPFSVLSCDQ